MGFEVIHLRKFSENGKGFKLVEVFANIFSLFGDLSTTSCLLFVASGWTLTYTNLFTDNNLDLMLPIGVFLGFTTIILGVMTLIGKDEHWNHHDFSGFQGYLVIFIKAVTLAGFFYLWMHTNKELPQKGKGFFMKFFVFGLLFIVSFPFFILGALFLPVYSRNMFVTIGTSIFQSLFLSLLLQQQQDRSTYVQASLRTGSILPQSLGAAPKII